MDDTDRIERALRLIDAEDADVSRAAQRLDRICSALSRVLPASGAAITLILDHQPGMVVAASAAGSGRLAEQQLTLGEGPAIDAAEARRPVLVPDLSVQDGVWPAFGAEARTVGTQAVFAFPMQVGAARVGVVEAHRDVPGALTSDQLLDALAFTRVALDSVLDHPSQGDGWGGKAVKDLLVGNSELFQAQGMVMIQLQVSLVEALSRIRAHAFAQDRRLTDVAREIVAGRINLVRDDSG